MVFKIRFPGNYSANDINKGNIDVNIILSDGTIYFGTFFTIANIQELLTNDTRCYFWATDMFIVKDLSRSTIRYSVSQAIQDGYFEDIFCKIGVIGEKKFSFYSDFDSIEDMTSTKFE